MVSETSTDVLGPAGLLQTFFQTQCLIMPLVLSYNLFGRIFALYQSIMSTLHLRAIKGYQDH